MLLIVKKIAALAGIHPTIQAAKGSEELTEQTVLERLIATLVRNPVE